ncbi:MAG: FAD-dependent oxidoreductase [Verrucomicrobiota bacterium]
MRTGVKILEVSKKGKGKRIAFQRGRRSEEIVVDEILYAMGRVPALEGLQLGHAGIELKNGRLVLDGQMATAVPHIFAAGDAAGPHEVVHIAIQQGELAAAQRGAPGARRRAAGGDDRLPPQRPGDVHRPGDRVGRPERAGGQGAGHRLPRGQLPLPRARQGDDRRPRVRFVKLIAGKTRGEILGGVIIGPHASDMIHELIAVKHYRGTAEELAKDAALPPHAGGDHHLPGGGDRRQDHARVRARARDEAYLAGRGRPDGGVCSDEDLLPSRG